MKKTQQLLAMTWKKNKLKFHKLSKRISRDDNEGYRKIIMKKKLQYQYLLLLYENCKKKQLIIAHIVWVVTGQ